MSLLRKAHWGLSWLFVIGVVAQFLFVGMALFMGAGFGLHIGFAYYGLGLVALLLLVLAFAAKLPGELKRISLWLLLDLVLQMTLPFLRGSLPIVAALHPVNALVLLWLSVKLLQDTRRLASPAL